MARAKRRSKNSAHSPEDGAADEHADDGAPTQEEQEEKCPACKPGGTELWGEADKENWVRCDACKTWYHWRCAGDGGDLDAVDKWFCKGCLAADPARSITMKPPARKSARKRTQRDYAGLNTGAEASQDKWMRILEGKEIKADPFKRMKGSEVGVEWIESDDTAMREPIVIESPEGLGMKMPQETFGVNDVAELLGRDFPVEVIDVASQSNIPGWTLGKWADYYATEPSKREKIRNVISLEISETDLAAKVLPPRLVRELDWVEKFWPSNKKGEGHNYPKVQLYCLMGVAGAWTDWHVDFAGSSVYYHILRGSKVFYFIRPTPANLAAYERWSGTEMQNHSWLGDMTDEVFKVELHEGNTMIIPTGWIHAVYTPVDTLVFGGNFLHSYNVATQLRVREIEIATHVPKKFRYPYFARLCWYAGEKYLRDLKAKEEFSPRVLESVEALADFLVSEVRAIERGNDHAKREAKEQVPSDRVKDAPALARELRWRARSAAGHSSDDERPRSSGSHGAVLLSGTKRKRSAMDSHERDGIFRNFRRKAWELEETKPPQVTKNVVKADRPGEGKLEDGWMDFTQDSEKNGEAEATVESRREVIIKVRRTAKGLERQRIERVVEDWSWPSNSQISAAKAEPVAVEERPTANGHVKNEGEG